MKMNRKYCVNYDWNCVKKSSLELSDIFHLMVPNGSRSRQHTLKACQSQHGIEILLIIGMANSQFGYQMRTYLK